VLAVTADAGDTQDFAGAHLKGNVVQGGQTAFAACADAMQRQAHVTLIHDFAARGQDHLTANHQARQLCPRDIPVGHDTGQPAFAQHGNAVADRQHFLELMADEDQRVAFGGHLA